MKRHLPLILWSAAGIAVVTVLIVQVLWLNAAVLFLRAHWVPVLILLVSVAAFGIAAFAPGRYPYRGRWVGIGVVGLVALAGTVIGGPYTTQSIYSRSVVVSDEPAPSLDGRLPYVIAQQFTANKVLTPGDVDPANTTYTTGGYTTPVDARTLLKQYTEVVTLVDNDAGGFDADNCAFAPEADRSLIGLFGHNLARPIIRDRWWTIIDRSDDYWFCDGETPYAVVPVKGLSGVWPVVEVPVGVYVYNGTTAELTFNETGEGLPGPSFSAVVGDEAA
ncbi:MAG: hypothetical protein ACK5LS_00340 [Propioniciclava sp.]